MITAIDTNVLLDIVRPNEEFFAASVTALEDAAGAGSLVICDLVYAELSVHFADQGDCDEFLGDSQIRVEPLGRSACFLAGRIWRTYCRRGGKRTRILTDFLIGAHALRQASRLLSRDRGFYRAMFPDLPLLDPAGMHGG